MMHTPPDSPATAAIRRVAIVGTGLIGCSWAAFFLGRGFDVVATDPAPNAEKFLRDYVQRVWPALERLGLAAGASPDRLTFTADLAEAVAAADLVQENGPEREALKVELFAELDRLAPATTLLASSSSGLSMSAIQVRCRHPERCLVAHPFNPPHLIPLVELVGGRATSPGYLEAADRFYTSLGKHTVRIRKEVPGHVANRLQAALWREAVHLAAEGVASVADIDAAVCWGPGLRWALMGPHLVLHLGGGTGGMEHFMEHLAGPFGRWWDDLGQPQLTPDVQEKIIRGVREEAGGRTIDALAAQRDEGLIQLLRLRQELG